MRPVALTLLKDGIDRLRTKGGAKADSAYDLVNCYITEKGTVVPRPGTLRDAALPAGTVGLTAFDGELHVFASETVDLDAYPGYALDILLHPSDGDGAVTEIHFAKPFLGALYIVAEFDSGEIFDYWLQPADAWEGGEEYSVNEFVTPTTPNGFVYRATRFGQGYPAWSPGVLRTAGNGSSIPPSIIEPTVYNEYYYTALSTQGANPRSGTVEPNWPTSDGETIIENTDGFAVSDADAVNPPDPPTANTPQTTTTDRYS